MIEGVFSNLSEEDKVWKAEIEEYLKDNLGPYIEDIEKFHQPMIPFQPYKMDISF